MANLLAPIMGSMKKFWGNISVSQRVFVTTLATLMVAVFIALLVWLNTPDYGLLYSNLSPEDANRIVKSLDTKQIPYRLEQNGTAILVPDNKIYELRINIAGDNLLTGQGIGFEIFNETQVGQTDFVQKINYRRALEGELSRTIAEFPSVEAVRVHLVLPQRSLFIEEQRKPSASILLKVGDGKKMEPKDVTAIVNLVAMSVEGLDKTRISIADTTGKVLFQPEEEGSLFGLNQTQFEHKTLTQENLERRIEELLMPIVGVGKVVARVNVEMDFDQKTIRKELFDPEKTVLRSEIRSESSTQGNANLRSGTSDPNFRGDGPVGTSSTEQHSEENRTSNFEINKEEYNIVSTPGTLERLSVAVVIDGTYAKGEDGKVVYTPRSDDELKQIRQLIASAVGFDSARGDVLEVSNMAFGETELAQETPIITIMADYAMRFGKPILNALLIFLFLILVVRPIVLALIKPKVEGKMIEGLEGLPESNERLALIEDSDETVAATAMLEKIEDIKIHALQLSEQNLDQAVGIIKIWLKEQPAEENKVPARAA